MPVPEPPPETATATFGLTLPYCSASDWAALTRVSEPLFWISVLADAPAAAIAPRVRTASLRNIEREVICSFSGW
ncbi:MAG: hypothetical protein AW09_003933 [Candidatus Accumulibacter phosphatis]|uniref:Uncharacterized protein n=1 Tax=Candidatus Accumulibacter phosphatis TaxID=327160 RepID=A0A080LTN1_9PROT|nr:MAG: hypothetical protein AW09_003933 [Candidatus Accumulibacter phosphatis]